MNHMAILNWICVQFIGVFFWFLVLITAFAMMVVGFDLYMGMTWNVVLADIIQLAVFGCLTWWVYSSIRSYFNEKAMLRAGSSNEQK